MASYAAAREGSAVFDLPDRAIIAVTGPLRLKFLQNILSNDVSSRAPGAGSRAALMDVKGHLLAFLRALVGADEVVLEVAGGQADAVERALVHYRVAAPVRFARPDVAVVGVAGPRAGDTIHSAGKEVGRVTTAGISPRLGPIAMGYVHRSAAEPGTEVEVAGAAATVVRLPFEER